MGKRRLEAFSDGVLAIIITIMVLELRPPHETSLDSLAALAPVFVSYVLSFIYIGIYWNNHHHLMTLVRNVSGGVLWANLHLLFWLSLIPFVTAWMGEHHEAALPAAAYGVVLLCAGIAFTILTRRLLAVHSKEALLAKAIGRDAKGIFSIVVYAIAIPLAFWSSWLSYALYGLVALVWLVPDRRVEKVLEAQR
ncbi:MAG: TMEM175 family protein [Bdellovibrionota bacterium]